MTTFILRTLPKNRIAANLIRSRNQQHQTIRTTPQPIFVVKVFISTSGWVHGSAALPNGTTSTGVKCWNCGSDINKIYKCCSCGKLQDLQQSTATNVDYFKLLQIERQFTINSTELSRNFRQLQSHVHPDKFAGKDEREQNNSIEWSTLLNKAYKILSVPLTRGEYMVKEEIGGQEQEGKTVKSQEFLMEMMEKNEEVENADTRTELEKLLEITDEDINKMLAELKTAFENKDFRNAKSILEKMKFLYSLKNGIKLKLESMLTE